MEQHLRMAQAAQGQERTAEKKPRANARTKATETELPVSAL